MEEKNKVLIPEEAIMSKIYLIRGQKVMLDNDLAELYAVETRRLNEQVKRNIDRFPGDFMFQLESVEFENLKSQFATSRWGGRRKLPYAFTEHGVLMLSSVLTSERAINVNIRIMGWSLSNGKWWSISAENATCVVILLILSYQVLNV
jgi:hypothetical protein